MIAHAGAQGAIDLATLRFLVVEDQGFQRWAIGHLLESLGAKYVFSAADGIEGLELFKASDPPIDVVVCDLNMPGMDGMEFIRHVGDFGQPVSVILASDLDRSLIASVGTMTRAYGVTFLEAIHKPVTAANLAAALALYKPPQPQPHAPPLEAATFTLQELEHGIRHDEFEPYFQAKVELATDAVRGAEAMARWRHPLHGIVGPESFIGVLESSWKMDELTMLILRKAAAVCRTWRRGGLNATVSVNVSLVSLTDVGLADRMTAITLEAGLEPRDVVLEVTETVAISHTGKVLENLSRLRMKGFGLSIDDYGTGYSSMQQLALIPFTELKIDQSFVRGAATERSSRAMLESSLEMAAKMGIVAVAEGVETREQAELLRSLGCQLAQGFYIARPMSAPDFLRWAIPRR
jgi:EAL domain-containing protein (putative c-di-GMP-specific phosphodiesterase class I)/FixJ family two-component response regulator